MMVLICITLMAGDVECFLFCYLPSIYHLQENVEIIHTHTRVGTRISVGKRLLDPPYNGKPIGND